MKELTIELTNKCAQNCIQCSSMAGKDGDKFLSLEEIAGHLDHFSDFDAVRLSGGEPFEHPEIIDVIKLCYDKGRKTQILSCGVIEKCSPIPYETFQAIKPYIDEVVFSIHGYYSMHDQIVSSDDNWVRQPPYWDAMMDSSDNANWEEVPIAFQSVIMKHNFSDLRRIAWCVNQISYSCKKPLKLHYLRYVKQGRGKTNAVQAPDLEQNAAIPGIMKSISEEFPNVKISYTNSFEAKQCDCGTRKAVVTIQGEVIPCSALKYASAEELSARMFACRERV